MGGNRLLEILHQLPGIGRARTFQAPPKSEGPCTKVYNVHPLLSEYNKLFDLLMAQWSGMTMVALGSLQPDISTSSTTPWGTPRGTTGRSRITCDVKVPNGIWCSVNFATLVLALSEIWELEQQMLCINV